MSVLEEFLVLTTFYITTPLPTELFSRISVAKIYSSSYLHRWVPLFCLNKCFKFSSILQKVLGQSVCTQLPEISFPKEQSAYNQTSLLQFNPEQHQYKRIVLVTKLELSWF